MALAWALGFTGGASVDLRLLTDAASRVLKVPRRGRRLLPRRNRLLEIHGLAGAISEQLGLAWTAAQDVHLFRETEPPYG